MNKYAQRDVIALGPLYAQHVSAMTAEGLHDKSDIAAELAYRDAEIERMRVALDDAQSLAIRRGDIQVRLQTNLAAARADATLLRSTLIDIAAVMGMSSLPSYSEWEKIRNKALQLVAALAGEKK